MSVVAQDAMGAVPSPVQVRATVNSAPDLVRFGPAGRFGAQAVSGMVPIVQQGPETAPLAAALGKCRRDDSSRFANGFVGVTHGERQP